jgi:hypothetical protein
VFEDISKKFTYPPDQENKILSEGHFWPTSPEDDIPKHIEEHIKAVQETGDPTGRIKQHIAHHRMDQIAQAMAQQQQGGPGTPGGAGQPGIAGQPKPGGQVASPRQNKQPAGAIAPDQLARAGAPQAPRR